jgi:hypothetical protein
MKIGVNIKMMINADREPKRVKMTASWALPCFNIWCPGRTERKVSSSGAPKKMDGMNDTKVCVIAIEVMTIARAMGEAVVKLVIEESITIDIELK